MTARAPRSLLLPALGAVAFVAAVPEPAAAVCSVLDHHPCAPTVCSVFRHGPCIPEIDYPIGQDLRLTIDTKTPPPAKPDGDLSTIAAVFKALRACWVPPDEDKARAGTEISVRLSFKRSGDAVGPPRWTYTSPRTPDETRQTYRDAVSAALTRCEPLHFTKGLGGAIAGRPIAIRYVENRDLPRDKGAP